MTIKAVIRGAAGTVMIDGTWRNLSFFNKRSIAAGDRQLITRVDDYVIWAYRCSDVGGGMFATSYGENATLSSRDRWSLSNPMQIYEFADLTIDRDPLGMNIRNELGILVFSTKMLPLCVKYHASGEIPLGSRDAAYTLFDQVLDSSRQYAVMIGDSPSVAVTTGGESLNMWGLTVFTGSDGRVTVKYDFRNFYAEGASGFKGSRVTSYRYSFQIIDVTNY